MWGCLLVFLVKPVQTVFLKEGILLREKIWSQSKKIPCWVRKFLLLKVATYDTVINIFTVCNFRSFHFMHTVHNWSYNAWLHTCNFVKNPPNCSQDIACSTFDSFNKFRFCLFVLILYIPVNNFWQFPVFLGWTDTKQQKKCLAQGYNIP